MLIPMKKTKKPKSASLFHQPLMIRVQAAVQQEHLMANGGRWNEKKKLHNKHKHTKKICLKNNKETGVYMGWDGKKHIRPKNISR